MLRTLFLATLLAALSPSVSGQAPSVLHVKVMLVDAEQKPTPVPRHALLISDEPPSAPPRRVVTKIDGTVDVTLRPGTYTVESDLPVAFNGQAYQWRQVVEIAAGRDTILELTADNAEAGPVTSVTTTSAVPMENDPSVLLSRWQGSVVALWTPTSRASGFVVDREGLVATSQRVIGAATSVEVQLTPAVKVAARVLAADPARDVAVLWISPSVTDSVRPVPLECPQTTPSPVADGQEIFTIGAPLRGQKQLASATVSRVEPRVILADFRLGPGSSGGPVFTADGVVVGITTAADETDEATRWDSRLVRIGEACEVLESAKTKMHQSPPPSGTHLPVEPTRPFPLDTLEDAARRRTGGLTPYQMSSSDFDIAFITPVLAYAAQKQSEQTGRQVRSTAGPSEAAQLRERLLTDFGQWSGYVAEVPPVLLVRVTPKFVEGFWTMVARGAASIQGVALPPMKRFKPGFSRMQAFCGSTEVTPIHPFKIEQRLSERDVIHEGLYVFHPGALAPHCGAVKLVVYSEKEPQKGDTRVVDPRVLQHIWQDVAPYLAQEPR